MANLTIGIADLKVIPQNSSLVIHCGKRILNLSVKEINERISSRSRAGDLLPKGFQKVDFVEVVRPVATDNTEQETTDTQVPDVSLDDFVLE